MRKQTLVLGSVLVLALSGAAFAQGRGGGGASANGAMGGAMGNNMGNMGSHAGMGAGTNFGGQSNANIGAQGRLNSNGPAAADRDFGADRAEDRPPPSTSESADVRANSASSLGKLNADHASANARQHAAAGSAVGNVATYQSQMNAALALGDPTARAKAITAARQQLAANDNKTLTASAVSQLDARLGIKGASPQLGTK